MRALPWDRAAVVASLAADIWRHVPSDATRSSVTLAATLLGLDAADVSRLADVHWVSGDTVRDLLDATPRLLRRLPSDTSRDVEVSVDRVRGPVDWAATTIARAAARPLPVVVARPVVRQADVPANRLLAFLLAEVRDRGRGLRLREGAAGTLGEVAASRARDAARHGRHPGLRGVRPVAPAPRDLVGLRDARNARRYDALLRCWDAHRALVAGRDPDVLRETVNEAGLATATAGTLFEVVVLFRIRSVLAADGWRVGRFGLFDGAVEFDATRDGTTLRVTYQRLPAGLAGGGRYVAALRAHGLSNPQDLRPDFAVEVRREGLPAWWLMVEAKTSTTGKHPAVLARRALVDLLAYRHAYGRVLEGQTVYGLGVLWGEGLRAAEHEVRVTTLDRLGGALNGLLNVL